MEKKISVSTIKGLLILLNCSTRIKKISTSDMIMAFPRKEEVSCSCSLCPLNLIVTSAGMAFCSLNSLIFVCSCALIGATMVRSSTLLCNWIVRFTFLRFTPPAVLVYSTVATELSGRDFTCMVFISIKVIRIFIRPVTSLRKSSRCRNWILYSSSPSLILLTSFPNTAVRSSIPIWAVLTPSIMARLRSTFTVISGLNRSTSGWRFSIPSTRFLSRY